MEGGRRSFLTGLLSSRSSVVELFTVAILLALGVNLVSDVINEGLSTPQTLFLGLAISFVSIVYLIFRYFRREQTVRFSGFLIYDSESNSILGVPNYNLAQDISTYLEGAFEEDSTLFEEWHSDPLSDKQLRNQNELESSPSPKGEASLQLLEEALEYYLLDHLSVHLVDYFRKPGFKPTLLKTLGRPDIPTSLLSNRFLDLFSKPMSDRPAFQDDNDENEFNIVYQDESGHREIQSVDKGGLIFSSFQLTLPSHSSISRTSDGLLCINGPYLKLELGLICPGFSSSLPRQFLEYYVECEPSVTVYSIAGVVRTRVKLRAFLSRRAWQYYMWIDSFIDSLQSDVDKERFFQTINWSTVEAVLGTYVGWFRQRRRARLIGAIRKRSDYLSDPHSSETPTDRMADQAQGIEDSTD